MQEAEEQDTCRICSAPAEPDQPLFHPCKCSGTIRYIHQDCLTTWLSHSKKKTCDVCKHPYSFTKVYAENMPSSLPFFLLLRRLVEQTFYTWLFILRALAVITVWLAILPWATVWTWRIYFSMGDSVAWWISDRPRPSYPANSETIISPFYTHIPSNPPPSSNHSQSSFGRLTSHPVWIALSADIFTGQIIASLIVLTFVAVFLLREWISQNARPGVFEDGGIEDVPAPAPAQVEAPPPVPAVLAQNQRQREQQEQLRQQQREERLVQGQIEAIRALDALRAREGIHGHIVGERRNHGRTELNFEEIKRARERQHGKAKLMRVPRTIRPEHAEVDVDWDVPFQDESARERAAFERKLLALKKRKQKMKEREQQETIAASTELRDPDDNFPVPSSARMPSSGSGSPFPQVVLQPPRENIPFSLSSPKRPPLPSSVPSSPLASPSLATYRAPEDLDGYFESVAGPSTSRQVSVETTQEESSEEEAASPSVVQEEMDAELEKYFPQPDVPDDEADVTLREEAAEVKEEEIEEIDLTEEEEAPPTDIGENEERENAESDREEEEEDRPVIPVWDEDDDPDEEPEEDEEVAHDAPVPQDVAVIAPALPMDVPAAAAPAAANDANINNAQLQQQQAELIDDLEGNVEDDMDGAMEAIGMRGPIYGVIQNVALMIFVLDTAIGVGVWLPFTIGKTTALLSLDPPRFLQIIHLPIRAIRLLTDPIVDGTMLVITRIILPPYMRIFSRLSTFFCKTALSIIGKSLGEDKADMTVILYHRALNLTEKPLEILSSIVMPTTSTATAVTSADPSLPTLPPTQNEMVIKFIDFAEPYFAMLGKEVRVAFTHFFEAWRALAIGQGSTEKVFAVGLGYSVVSLTLALYLNILTVGNVKNAGKAVRSAVRQQLLIIKVAAFIFIELALFPLGCGIVLDACTMWVFPDTDITSRMAFFQIAPLTALFYHWVAGTLFMYTFAVILAGCRSIMRPGAMWFVRDPQDQNTHPIRDILERPTFTQLRKILISAIMYAMVVLLTVVSIGGLLLMGKLSIAPLRWKTREPLSSVPIDLIFLHLTLPYTMHYFRPRRALRKVVSVVWRYLARKLRLTSYFFGERRPSEEFTPMTWGLNPFKAKKPLMSEPHVHDGSFRRVPATDNISLPREMRATAACTETGEPVDEASKILIEQQNREAEKGKRDASKDYTVVYLPPRFASRVILFMICLWVLGSLATGIAVALPIQLGRSFFKLFIAQDVHDGYSFLVGFYLLWGCYIIGKAVDRLDKRRQRRGGDGPRADLRILVIKRGLLWIVKISYMAIFLGVTIPTMIALVMELYVVLPIRFVIDKSFVPRLRFVDLWALGLLYMKIGLHTRRPDQDNRVSRGIEHIKHNGWTHPDPVAASKEVIGPALLGLSGMIVLPGAFFMLLQYLLPNRLDSKLLFMHVYPSIFALASLAHSSVAFADIIRSWAQSIRDKEFLLEMRLRNHEPEVKKGTQKEAAAVVAIDDSADE